MGGVDRLGVPDLLRLVEGPLRLPCVLLGPLFRQHRLGQLFGVRRDFVDPLQRFRFQRVDAAVVPLGQLGGDVAGRDQQMPPHDGGPDHDHRPTRFTLGAATVTTCSEKRCEVRTSPSVP